MSINLRSCIDVLMDWHFYRGRARKVRDVQVTITQITGKTLICLAAECHVSRLSLSCCLICVGKLTGARFISHSSDTLQPSQQCHRTYLLKNSSSDSVKYLIIHRTDFFGQKDSYYSKGGIICYNSSYIIFCSIKVSGNWGIAKCLKEGVHMSELQICMYCLSQSI